MTMLLPKDVNRFFVGFNDQFERFDSLTRELSKQSYPPYNIIRINENKYRVELAVSGFYESEIDIEFAKESNQGILKIVGKKENQNTDYIHHGIGFRDFTRTFILNPDIVVNSAKMENGLLSVELEQIVPEEKKPLKIQINSSPRKSEKTLLTE